MVCVISEVRGSESDNWSDKIGILYVLCNDGEPESLIKYVRISLFDFEWY